MTNQIRAAEPVRHDRSFSASVGSFLGMGEREVKVGWNDLKISQNDEKVTVDTTQGQPGRHAGHGQFRWCS